MSDKPYSSITVSGPDAFDFLQAQLTTDVAAVKRDETTRTAWCNPKGRVICIPYISGGEDEFVLSVPTELAESLVRRMTLFRFRSQVDFKMTAANNVTVDQLANLSAGLPEIGLQQSEKFTPHMLNLDLLDIVSLDKGCYPGQEIVARTHYRGASKRRCMRFESNAPVSPGDKVSDGRRDIGEVVNAIGTDLLAVIPVNSVNDALSIRDLPLRHIDLPYVTNA